ncbi:MAG: hypothetical protein NVS3B21_01550 [Acidimicrobiales bacterium]
MLRPGDVRHARSFRWTIVATASCLLAACTGGGAVRPAIVLDGSPHRFNAAGVVTSADRRHVVLDDRRSYAVDPKLVVFDAGTLQVSPLVDAVGRFALIGTRGRRVVWLEPLSVVVTLPGAAPAVLTFGSLARIESGPPSRSAVFADGTVVPLASGIQLPEGVVLPARVRADIDPVSHMITALVAA